jgi:membrane associated rhomboid family serine protease
MLGERRVLEPAPGVQRSVARQRSFERIPWVSWGIIAACAAVFLAEYLLHLDLYSWGALYGPYVRDEREWYRAVSTVFVHGGPWHLVLNMSVVWTLGTQLERAIRSWRFLLVSIITMLGSAAFVLWLGPAVPTVGASGMILGWAGVILPIATKEGRRTIGIWLLQVAVISLLPFVSWQGHLGGFVFGLPCGLLLRNHGRYFTIGAPVLILFGLIAVYFAGINFHGAVPTR